MFSLVYYSQAKLPFSEEKLYRLAVKANKKNKGLKITGFLQYKVDHFLQYLEGKQDHVMMVMDAIQRDPRHVVLRTVILKDTETRRFDNWHMRYWKESEFKYLKLVDLLSIILNDMYANLFSEEILQDRITKLVDLMSENQQFIKDLEKTH